MSQKQDKSQKEEKQEKEEKDIKRHQPVFPTARIKKIIQENQEIGKLSNLIPPLVEKSLQIFLEELLAKTVEVAKEKSITKLTPQILKKALQSLEHYDFMKDALNDVQEGLIPLTQKKTSKSVSSGLEGKRSYSSGENKEEKGKRGRKKVKVEEQIVNLDSEN